MCKMTDAPFLPPSLWSYPYRIIFQYVLAHIGCTIYWAVWEMFLSGPLKNLRVLSLPLLASIPNHYTMVHAVQGCETATIFSSLEIIICSTVFYISPLLLLEWLHWNHAESGVRVKRQDQTVQCGWMLAHVWTGKLITRKIWPHKC